MYICFPILGLSSARAEVVLLDEVIPSLHPEASSVPPMGEIKRKKEEKKRRGAEQRATRKRKIKLQKEIEKAQKAQKAQDAQETQSASAENTLKKPVNVERHKVVKLPRKHLQQEDQTPSPSTEEDAEVTSNNEVICLNDLNIHIHNKQSYT